MDITHINTEKKPEVATTMKEDASKETKAFSLFSDLNSESMSTKKLLALTGGVLSVALLAIFLIDSFMIAPRDTAKKVDVKNETKSTPTRTEEVKGAEEFASPETSADDSANNAVQLPKKPTITKAPVATQAPTNKPEPTAAPTATPTQAPTAVPTTAPTVAPTTTPEMTPIPTI